MFQKLIFGQICMQIWEYLHKEKSWKEQGASEISKMYEKKIHTCTWNGWILSINYDVMIYQINSKMCIKKSTEAQYISILLFKDQF